ncbi:MAG: hypothetical protein PHF97_07950 [Bacteroidales bacterium]|nr:hypothetical protein [Bacteroidales bacterium]
MERTAWYLKMFNIRKEEMKPVFLLMVFSFFVGLSLSFYFTASNAIFLKHFHPKMISWSYMVSGVIVCAAWWILSRLDKILTVPWQLIVKFLFVFLTVLAITIGVWMFDTPWLAFIMFTWVRVLVYITLVTFWGLAGKLFNIRQGKRIFGLIGVGEVVSIIIGYFSIPLILHFLKAPDLLFLSSISLFVCFCVVIVILRVFRDQLSANAVPESNKTQKFKSEWNYWNLLKKPYFLMISLMALLPIFGYLFVDFLFLAQTKREFSNNPETIASFFGLFLGFVAIVELIFKLVSGRFLNKYGLKPSLLSLPLILLVSTFFAASWGSVYGTVGMFFAFIALARLFERSIRGAVYEPAFQLLYQPVPSEQRLPFQNQIEGIPKALGTVITGAVILLLSSIPAFTMVHYSWVFIFILGAWIWIAFKMYEEYRSMLKSKLTELPHKNTNETEPMGTLIAKTLSSAQPQQFQTRYAFFDKVAPSDIASGLEQAYSLSLPLIQEAILKKINEIQLVPVLGFLTRCYEKNEIPELREKLRETIGSLKEAEDMTFEQMATFARSDDPLIRVKIATLLGYSGRYNTYKLLIQLIKDTNAEVKKAALISSGKIRRYELWPFIIENLTHPLYSHEAINAVKLIGEPILADLDRFFEKNTDHPQTRLHIIKIYETIGGTQAIHFLRGKINYPEKDLQYQVLISLSNLEYRASVSEIPVIKQAIEESVKIIVWIMASLVDIGGSKETTNIQEALLEEMEKKKEEVFLLLSLIYESKTIRHIREHIESPDTNAKIYALEIGDMLISEDIKELFFPLFEDLSINDRLLRFNVHFPQEKLSSEERLHDIINKDYSKISKWTKACALEVLGQSDYLSTPSNCELLAANVVNPDPMLSEMAAWVLYHKNKEYFFNTIHRFEKKGNIQLNRLHQKITARETQKVPLLYDEVVALKNTSFLAPVPEIQILNMIVFLNENIKNISKGWKIPCGSLNEITIPWEELYEMIDGNRIMIERFVSLFLLNNAYTKDYE